MTRSAVFAHREIAFSQFITQNIIILIFPNLIIHSNARVCHYYDAVIFFYYRNKAFPPPSLPPRKFSPAKIATTVSKFIFLCYTFIKRLCFTVM